MSGMDGSGHLSETKARWPQGSLQYLRESGLDPAKVGSCAAPAPGVRGCPFWHDCIFDKKKYGITKPFKGNGPEFVGYILKTPDDVKKEDDMLCYRFNQVFRKRMLAMNALAEEGKEHDVIRIIAHEGEPILKRFQYPIDPNPNKSKDYRLRYEDKLVPVSTFKNLRSVGYSALVEQRERLRQTGADEPVERLRPEFPAEPAEAVVAEPVRKKAS